MKRGILIGIVAVLILALLCALLYIQTRWTSRELSHTNQEKPYTVGFRWTVREGTAILIGPGNVTDSHIILPETVRLVPGLPEPNGYKLDPQCLTADSFPNWGISYTMSDTDGNTVDRNNLDSSSVYLEKVLVYDPKVIKSLLQQGEFGDMKFTLRLGQIVDANNIECITDLTKYSREKPLQLYINPNTDTDPYVEDAVNGVSYPVTVAGGAFYNCDFIQTVQFSDGTQVDKNLMWNEMNQGMFEDCDGLTAVYNIPSSVTSMLRTFYDCDNLVVAPELPASLQNMDLCFTSCDLLEVVPAIPAGVVYMSRTFENCRRLKQMPGIPESAREVRHCFSECTSLTGTVTLPREAAHWGARETLAHSVIHGVFEGCTNLDKILVEYCPGYFDSSVLSDTAQVEFTGIHEENTLCPVCDNLNGIFPIEGLNIYGDGIAGEAVRELQAFWQQLPQLLRENCEYIYLTTDITAYYDTDAYGLKGFAYSFDGIIYLQVDQENDLSDSTLYHELGHCLDGFNGSSFSYSASDEWKEIHEAEGEKIAYYHYSYSYNTYPLETRRAETFAMAVECYFIKPFWMMENTPQMYEYMENMFSQTK